MAQSPRLFLNQRILTVEGPEGQRDIDLYSAEGFELLSRLWVRSGWQQRLSYRLTWMGIPIIQLPEDLLMMQELIYKMRPQVIVETGTAHGGTAIFYASMLALLGQGRVISVDVEIRHYNRLAIHAHPLSERITLIEGSSVSDAVVADVRQMIRPREVVLVALDSNHSYAHVRAELEAYAPLVTPGSYLVVFDGIMDSVADAPNGRPEWTTDNPGRAVEDFLSHHPEFEIDRYYNRLLVTYCPAGFLRRKVAGAVDSPEARAGA
jgi:cephalosporin hydroxylase